MYGIFAIKKNYKHAQSRLLLIAEVKKLHVFQPTNAYMYTLQNIEKIKYLMYFPKRRGRK